MSVSPANNGALTVIKDHPTFAIGGGIVLLLLVVAYVNRKNNAGAATALSAGTATPGATGASDLSGLGVDANGNPIVYVPTSTSFSTDNSTTETATSAPGAPATINNSTNTTKTSSTTSTVGTGPLLPVHPISKGGTPTGGTHPVKKPPVKAPAHKAIHWSRGHHVGSGETLTSIAAQATNMCRQAGAPGNFKCTAQQIYTNNQHVIDSTAKAHHAPTPYLNHVYPGELLVVPEYK